MGHLMLSNILLTHFVLMRNTILSCVRIIFQQSEKVLIKYYLTSILMTMKPSITIDNCVKRNVDVLCCH